MVLYLQRRRLCWFLPIKSVKVVQKQRLNSTIFLLITRQHRVPKCSAAIYPTWRQSLKSRAFLNRVSSQWSSPATPACPQLPSQLWNRAPAALPAPRFLFLVIRPKTTMDPTQAPMTTNTEFLSKAQSQCNLQRFLARQSIRKNSQSHKVSRKVAIFRKDPDHCVK